MIKRAIRAVVHRLLGIDRVRWLVQAELAARRPAAPAPPRSDVGATRTYRGAAPEDLLATFVSVIVRRPAEPAPS